MESIKLKFKIGDKITNRMQPGVFTVTGVDKNCYLLQNEKGEPCYFWCAYEEFWELVEDEKKLEDRSLDEYEEYTDRAFKGGYEKCKSDTELNDFQLPDGYQFVDENGNVINATKIVLDKKESKYPKTYAECCKVLGLSEFEYNHTGTKVWYRHKLMATLDDLMLCRDAYWKIAGEKMGLDKPWEPDWSAKDNHFYTIPTFNGKIECSATAHRNAVLIFPTEEMRDAFYEAFKELIEECKELL